MENLRNRRQARREPQPGTPAYGGAGAPLAGMRPGSGMQAHQLDRVLVRTYAVASPKGGPAPRFGAHTWQGFVTQHDVDSRRVFGHELMEQDTTAKGLSTPARDAPHFAG